MHRHWTVGAALAWACAALAATRTPAQGIAGLLRTADGSPLADAEVTCYPRAFGADVAGLEAVLPEAPPVRTHSDARGTFKLPAGGTGLLTVTHLRGVGANVEVEPGERMRVVATPLAALTLPPDSRGAYLRLGFDGCEVALGFRAGTELRLPAGEYRVLAQFGDGTHSEHTVALRAGDRVTLFRPAAPALRMACDGAARAVLDGWSEVPVLADAQQHLDLWPTTSRGARHLLWSLPGPDAARSFAEQLCDARTTRRLTPPALRWRREAVAGVGHIIAVQPGPTLRPVAIAPIVDGHAHVPDDELLRFVVLAEGAPLQLRTRAELLESSAGIARLHVDVSAARGPIDGATVELQGGGVRRRARTGASGRATFTAVADAPTEVTVLSDDHWVTPRSIAAAECSTGRIALTAEPGATILGRITLQGRGLRADERVSLTLRDPTATLGFGERHVQVGADGRFAARGLPVDARFTLFATLTSGAITYSAKLHGALAGTEVALDLRSEDVPLPGRD